MDKSLQTSILVVTGPTASGKSALSLSLAKSIVKAEIVNADSVQVYRDFDIASAKPSAEELASLPHHLFSFLSPEQEFNAFTFSQCADSAIAEITQRGNLPIVCGGTGLYLQTLLNGLGSFSLSPSESRYRALVLIVLPERESLYRKIEERVELMFEQGLLAEVESLLQRYPRSAKAFSSIGYKEVLEFLDGEKTYELAKEKIKQHSRNLAKRQYTWWRNQPAKINWFAVGDAQWSLSSVLNDFLEARPRFAANQVFYRIIRQIPAS